MKFLPAVFLCCETVLGDKKALEKAHIFRRKKQVLDVKNQIRYS